MTRSYEKSKYCPIDPRVLRALERAPGYFAPRQIAEYLGESRSTINSAFGRLIVLRDIDCVGTAESAGLKDLPPKTKLYGLKGTPRIVPKVEAAELTYEERLRIAPPNRGHEFKLLKRDPFELMKLAMTTRGAAR